MIFTETKLVGAYLIDIEPIEDERGFFARTWSIDEFAAHGLETTVSQSSIAYNRQRNTLRGLHFQLPPFEETKLVRCTRGAVYDVIVDLRRESRTFREWFAVELTEANRTTLYVPAGFAHGYQTLTDEVEVWYQMSAPYAPQAARGVRWNDPEIGIDWPLAEQRIISARDESWPALREFVSAF